MVRHILPTVPFLGAGFLCQLMNECHRRRMASIPQFHPFCKICGWPVPLEECNTDECGSAVHERCYADSLTSADPGMRRARTFLIDATIADSKSCSNCGSQIEHATAVFHHEGSIWDVLLPFCPKCTAPLSDSGFIAKLGRGLRSLVSSNAGLKR